MKWGWIGRQITKLAKWAARDPKVQEAVLRKMLKKLAKGVKDEKQPVPRCQAKESESGRLCELPVGHGPMHEAEHGTSRLNWWP